MPFDDCFGNDTKDHFFYCRCHCIFSAMVAMIIITFLSVGGCSGKSSGGGDNGGGGAGGNVNPQPSISIFNSQQEFPLCSESIKNNLVYSVADRTIFTCDGTSYIKVNDVSISVPAATASTTSTTQAAVATTSTSTTSTSSGSSSTSSTAASVSGVAALAMACPTAQSSIPEPSGLTGQLIIDIPSDVDPCSADGFIVGRASTNKLNLSKSGQFFINEVPPGQHDIIVTGSSLNISSLSLVTQAPNRGIRVNQVRSVTGIATSVGRIKLQKFGSISGKVTLTADSGISDYAGISVYIPGTSYSALSGTDGSYTISDVPPGTHNLFFEKDGFDRGQVESVSVEGSQNTAIEDVTLGLETSENGSFSITNKFTTGGGQSIIPSIYAELMLIPPSDGVLMMVKDSYSEGLWRPIKTNYTFNFDIENIIDITASVNGYIQSPFSNNLLVKYANANGLESDVITKSFYLDYFSNGTSYFVPQFSVSVSSSPLTLNFSSIVNPSTAEEMAFYYQIGYAAYTVPTSLTFESIKTSKSVSILDKFSNCGIYYAYIFYKGDSGKVRFMNINDPFSSTVSLAKTTVNKCYDDITSTTNAPQMRRLDGSSYYHYYNAVWTGSEVVVVGFDGDSSLTGGRYNPTTNLWSSLNTTTGDYLPTARRNFLLQKAGNYVFLLFGQDNSGNNKNDLFAYDLTGNSWIDPDPQDSAPTLSSYSWHNVESDGRYLIFVSSSGHWNGSTYDFAYTLYDSQQLPAGNPWLAEKYVSGVPALYDAGMLPLSGKMFIAGGVSNSSSNMTSYLLDLEAATVTQKANLPANTFIRSNIYPGYHGANVDPDDSNLLHFFSSYNSSYSLLNYNASSNIWTSGNLASASYALYTYYPPITVGNELIVLSNGYSFYIVNQASGSAMYSFFGSYSSDATTPPLWPIYNADVALLIPSLKKAFIWGGTRSYYSGGSTTYVDYRSGVLV
ncbi:MAG: carboxypeptidase regulatory-like domain-containing protein, partial [Oligoflexales bacterium]|nr:carboxypeptidase regulatory-like domain-containing protein [Oligoflexales bacterium]